MKQFLFVAGSIAMTTVVIATRKTATANAEPATGSRAPLFSLGEDRKLRDELQSARGELSLVRAQFERADKIMQYSTKYAITAGMAGKVFDASLREGIDPELAFRLVRLESEFNEHAVSKVGAVGLTQLMPSTAVLFEKGVSREKLFNGETNLRIGFRYLRTLLDMYKGDVRLALLAYNRGEDAVWRDVKNGVNPGNGYDRWVMRDYRGKGLLPTQ
jgi:soluble lytic murein transglycosylase-like protein